MGDKKQEPKQKTRKGLEIPVPKRREVFEVFEKAAKTDSDSLDRPVKK